MQLKLCTPLHIKATAILKGRPIIYSVGKKMNKSQSPISKGLVSDEEQSNQSAVVFVSHWEKIANQQKCLIQLSQSSIAIQIQMTITWWRKMLQVSARSPDWMKGFEYSVIDSQHCCYLKNKKVGQKYTQSQISIQMCTH